MEIIGLIIGGFILLVLMAVAVSSKYSSPEFIGKYGEARTSKYLSRLSSESYKLFSDLTIADSHGRTTQIDHVVVSRYGIFVVETKCFKGWIFGSEKSKMWTQSLYTGRRWFSRSEKHKFQNPIKQNWRHIYVLAERLRLPKYRFHNIVVFAGDAEIKTAMPCNVMDEYDVPGYIQSFNETVFSDVRVGEICRNLESIRISSEEGSDVLHVQSLNMRHRSVREGDVIPCCPRCGSQMRKRYRRLDSVPFYGCCRYPECKGVVNIETRIKSDRH